MRQWTVRIELNATTQLAHVGCNLGWAMQLISLERDLNPDVRITLTSFPS